MHHRKALRAAAAALACAAIALVPVASGAAAPAARGTGQATMLVFLRPHVAAGSARSRAAVVEDQAAVAAAADAIGARVVARASVPDVLTVRASGAEARSLARDPLVEAVLANTRVPGPVVPAVGLGAPRDAARSGTPAHAPCGTATKPELDPEALGNVDAAGATALGDDGAGVKVAFLADGIDPRDADLQRNARFASSGSAAGTPVISSYADFSGDGTSAPTDGEEAFGDAASIAAQGNEVYDLSRAVGRAHPLHAGCDVRIEGDAPGATLLALKVFGYENQAYSASIVQAVNYAVAKGAKVINESFGFNDFPSSSADAVRLADDAAVAAGVTVVVSSGDAGISGTVQSPASDPNVVAVGATTTYRAYAQQTFGGINAITDTAGYLDDNISSLSSGGIAQDGKTVNLVAPGDLGWSLCLRADGVLGCGGPVQLFGGTSESSPLTSGAAADVIQAYASTHGGADPTPALVKQILTSTARDVDAPADQQGAGLLDVGAAVRLARSVAGTTDPSPPGGLLSDTSQLELSGAPSTAQTATVGLTNTATAPVTVTLSTRDLVATRATSGTVTIDGSARLKQPTFVDDDGFRNVEQRVAIRVAPHTARLQVDAAFSTFNELQVSLFAPDGALAGYSLPQGFANYADVEVAVPAPGVWTAVFFDPSPQRVQVRYTARSWRFGTDGTVTPGSVTIAAGATSDVSLDETLPPTPGDASLALVVAARGRTTTIPVVVRTMVDVGAQGARFSGTLTGGNGRFGAPGQTNTYALAVPAGEHDLDVGVALAANPPGAGQLLEGFLVDPSGNAQALATNEGTDDALSKYLDLYVADPAEGTWQLVLEWDQPGAGLRTSVGFVCAVRFDAVSVTSGLPDATTTKVPAAGASFAVTVRNRGLAPLFVTPDARLEGSTTRQVRILAERATQTLSSAFGVFAVPTQTFSVQFSTVSSVTASFEADSLDGDPVLSPSTDAPYSHGSVSRWSATTVFSPPGAVPSGIWELSPEELGPFGSSGARPGFVTMAAHVTMRPFDPAVRTSIPDVVEGLFDKGLSAKGSPVTVQPGASVTFHVTITPDAAPGTVVTGTLFVNTDTGGYTVSTLAAFPYEYVVG